MKNFAALCLILAWLPLACKQNTSQTSVSPVDSVRAVVMNLHNTEMEKMGEMKMLERALKIAIETADEEQDDVAYLSLSEAMIQLDSGIFAMKSWMRNWSEPDPLLPLSSQLQGLARQHASMKRTSELMNKGIIAAQTALTYE